MLPEVPFNFCPGLNVLMANAGGGKTHLLSLLYALSGEGTASAVSRCLADAFSVEHLGKLVRRDCENAEAFLQLATGSVRLGLDKKTGAVRLSAEDQNAEKSAVFLSLFRGLDAKEGAAVKRRELPENLRQCLRSLEKTLGGTVSYARSAQKWRLKTDAGIFFSEQLSTGERQLLGLAAVVLSGELTVGSTLFWDAPEAGMHPAFFGCVAECLLSLAAAGIQVFVATNSVFLVRELDLQRTAESKLRVLEKWTVLKGAHLAPEQEDEVWQLDTWTAFDAESRQTERFLAMEWELSQ